MTSEIGIRIRQQRKKLNLSLRNLAERVGVSASFLAQVERGETNPSLVSLQQVAKALEVPIFHLVEERVHEQMRVVSIEKRRKLSFPDSGITYELLQPSLKHKSIGLVVHLGPNDRIEPLHLAEATEEWLLVIQGEVEINIAGDRYKLEPGDSIWYEGWELKEIVVIGNTDATLVGNMTPPAF